MDGARCPLCGGAVIRWLGETCHGPEPRIAGLPVRLDDYARYLGQCADCAYCFKYPPPPPAVLMACYAAASEAVWERDPDVRVRQFDRFGAVLRGYVPGGRILDVGCFNGAFLASLGSGWDKFGVEPNRRAAGLAAARGVAVLGAELAGLPPALAPFDAIVALDILEHLPAPAGFFAQAAGRLAPGGVLLALTGDTASDLWRWYGPRVWYASLPEHLGFFCRRAFEAVGAVHGLECVYHRRLAHKRRPPHHRLANYARHALFRARVALSPADAAIRHRAAPTAFSLADHGLTVLRKPL